MTTVMHELRVISMLGLVLGLYACNGSSDSLGPPNTTPPPSGDPQIALERAFSQILFAAPVAMMQAPGDSVRWFVVEKGGVVRVFDNDPNVTSSSVFIDISGRVDSSFGESGLLGMAFHPDFPANPQVFLSYTSTGSILIGIPLVSNVSRFVSLDGGATLAPASELTIMTVLQEFVNHNGGNIAFGPDGFLYAGWGDGGSGGDPLNRAQDTTNLLGAITRVDVDGGIPYAIPPNNPFAGASICVDGFSVGAANCPEIYAWGLRNPWRWSFDRSTGELWVGDVGQNDWEEIDRVERSMNYGWREREGAHCFNPASGCSTAFVDPITEYGRSDGNSVTGGYVYRGSSIPDLLGHYVYADFGSGRVWTIPANSVQGTPGLEQLATGNSIASFAEDNDGELYLLDFGPGEIYRIVDAP